MKNFLSPKITSSILAVLALLPASSSAVNAILTDDASVKLRGAKVTYGMASTLLVSPSFSTFLKFDLGTLPANTTGANVLKAYLRVFPRTVEKAGNFEIGVPTATWSEVTLNTVNAPAVRVVPETNLAVNLDQKKRELVIDVTDIVKDWIDGVQPNNGLVLKASAASIVSFVLDAKESVGFMPSLEIVIANSGSQGLKGDTGDQGPQGLKGDIGNVGPQGLQGIQGIKGDIGATGSQGLKGDTGDQGPQGLKGDTGSQGPQGLQGIQGIKGDIGNTGPQGLKGDTGDQGPQGLQGIQGLKGDIGATGSQGLKGDTGDLGPQGLQGIQGIKGDIGATGSQGVKGDTGDQGPQGLQGIQGVKGDIGATGSQGLKGDTGDQGTQGLKGDTGNQGLQGIQGIKGDIGATGSQGVKGDTGDLGPQGLKGDIGATGVNSYTFISGDFTQPAVGGDVTVQVQNSAWIGVGQNLFIESAGYFTVNSIPDSTSLSLRLSTDKLATAGAMIAAGKKISPSGNIAQSNYRLLFQPSYINPNTAIAREETTSGSPVTWTMRQDEIYIPPDIQSLRIKLEAGWHYTNWYGGVLYYGGPPAPYTLDIVFKIGNVSVHQFTLITQGGFSKDITINPASLAIPTDFTSFSIVATKRDYGSGNSAIVVMPMTSGGTSFVRMWLIGGPPL